MVLPRPPRAVVFDMDGLLFDSEKLYRAGVVAAIAAHGHELPEAFYNAFRSQLGDDFDFTSLWKLAGEHVNALIDAELRLKTGVIELLDHLDALKLPRAIATSSRHQTVERYLASHDLRGRFDAVIAQGDYARGKPFPDPYLKAAERLGLAPEDCIALEDSHHGVRAAASAGMMTIMVPDLVAPTDEMEALCVTIARDLHVVRSLIPD